MHEREVVIKLRVEADQSATRAATQAMSKAQRAVQDRTKAEEQLAGALKRVQQVERERTRAMGQYQSAMDRVRGAQTQLAERFNTGLGDVMRFSRGLAMMGLAGEENTKKLLQGLVKIQATVDVIAGGVGVWIRMSNAMRDYASMTQAAAAAHTALAAAQGRSAVSGAASNVATGGALGGRLLAGAGRVASKAGALGIIAGGAAAWGHLGLTGYEVASGQGLGGAMSRYARFSRWTGLGSYSHINELAGTISGLERAEHRRGLMPQLIAAQQQRGQAMGSMSALRMQGTGASGVDTALSGARGVLAGGAEAGYNVAELSQAQAELQAGIQRRVQLYEEERRAVAQTAAEKARAMGEELSGIQRTMAMHEAALKQRQAAYASAAERFAVMDPMQQQQVLAAGRAVQAGTASAQQAAMARGFAAQGGAIDTAAGRIQQEAARRAGYYGVFGSGHEAGIGAEQRGMETARAAATEMEKQMRGSLSDAKRTGESIGKKMAELLKEQRQAMLAAMEDQASQTHAEIMDIRRQMAIRN